MPVGPAHESRRARLWRAVQCSVLFLGVVLLVGVGSEAARAGAAAAMGIPNTLFSFGIVYEQAEVSAREAAVILLTPHAWELAIAAIGALVYVRARSASLRLFALYLSAAGAMDLLMAIAVSPFSGDLHDLAAVLDAPALLVAPLAITGSTLLAAVWWAAGTRLQPPVTTILSPWIADLVVRPVVYAPIPTGLILTMWAGSAPWIAVIAVALWQGRRHAPAAGAAADPIPMRLWFSAWMLPVLLALIVRVMTLGIRLG